MRSKTLWAGIIPAAHLCAAMAQISPSPPPAVAAGAFAGQAFTVGPDGSSLRPAKPAAVRLQSEVLRSPQKLDDILGRHNLANTPQNRRVFQSLNPSIDFSKGVVDAGTKVDIFSVVPESGATNKLLYVFNTVDIRRYAFSIQSQRAADDAKLANSLPQTAFQRPASLQLHVRSARDIQLAAETLEREAPKLSNADYAVAQYQLDLAARVNTQTSREAAKFGKVPDFQVEDAAAAAVTLTKMSQRVAAGQSPTDRRQLNVNVFDGDSSTHVRKLQVYLVPNGAFKYRENWTLQELEAMVSTFGSEREASPDSVVVPIALEMWVCVGPEKAFSGMARLVKEDKLKRCTKSFASSASTKQPTTVVFRSPRDVAKP